MHFLNLSQFFNFPQFFNEMKNNEEESFLSSVKCRIRTVYYGLVFDILFSKICHMLGLSGTSPYAVFVYLCICIFVFVRPTHGNMIFDILEQSSFQKYTTCWVFLALRHMLYLCICVFVYLCICIFVFVRLTHVNIIFDTSEQSSFQKYTTCWVFLALCNMLYLCICVFVFVYLSMRHLVISVLISWDQELSENIWFVWPKTS